ncbi:predicted protein [Histoplasma capsulatum H143]|uniref:Uncharacterized protein n=1 Tax=Ajellomyces capsulatus (strain H143) TaxID=544712 RepID=C6HS35_AJECH|nr:predicted protein [Histoplasma capsulatum H143]
MAPPTVASHSRLANDLLTFSTKRQNCLGFGHRAEISIEYSVDNDLASSLFQSLVLVSLDKVYLTKLEFSPSLPGCAPSQLGEFSMTLRTSAMSGMAPVGKHLGLPILRVPIGTNNAHAHNRLPPHFHPPEAAESREMQDRRRSEVEPTAREK